MFSFFRRRKPKESEPSEAFKLGYDAGGKISDYVTSVVDHICTSRREKFLMVLDQRLTGIKPTQGVTYADQARIEISVMWENWRSYEPELEAEAWKLITDEWQEVLSQFGCEQEIRDMIHSRVALHSTELFAGGVSNAAEAIDHFQPKS